MKSDETENAALQCAINGNFYEIDTILSLVCPIGYQSAGNIKDCCNLISSTTKWYRMATFLKCLSNGNWNTTEILCNLIDTSDPENSEKLKLKKFLLKTCLILSGLRKSF